MLSDKKILLLFLIHEFSCKSKQPLPVNLKPTSVFSTYYSDFIDISISRLKLVTLHSSFFRFTIFGNQSLKPFLDQTKIKLNEYMY